MFQIIGWVIFGIVVFLAIGFAIGCRVYVKTGRGVHWATAVQTFFLWLIAVIFFLFGWNKFHLLWVVPLAFFGAQLLVIGGIPILTPIVLLATRMFIKIILIGIKKPY